MRFERLHLLRYGAFTDREIRFRDDAKLHVVYGPNEAGKSTTLSALSALLFGFPHQKTHDYLHDANALRVGATIRASDGSSLSFRRRRGNKATLLADSDDETALKDDALSSFIGSLTRSIFENAFGLDSSRLREGAEAMLANEGELGGTLIAAASGLTGLRELRLGLESEADGLYTPQGKKKEFNGLVLRLAEAKSKARDRELRSSDWKKLAGDIAELERRYEAAKQDRVAAVKRRNDLATLRQLHPVIGEIDLLRRKLEDFSQLSSLHRGFGEELRSALSTHEAAAADLALARQKAERASLAFAAIDLDRNVLIHAKAVDALHARLGDYLEKKAQTPRIDAERRGFDREIEDRFAQLGLTDEDGHRRSPPTSTLTLALELADEGDRIALEAETLGARLAEERDGAADLERSAPSDRLVDPKPLRDRMTSLREEIEAVNELHRLQSEHRREARRIAEDGSRLTPPVEDVKRLAVLSLPRAEWVASLQDRMTATQGRIERSTERCGEIEEEQARNAHRMRELERGGELPSRTAIESARAARDAAFGPIADAFSGKTVLPAGDEAKNRISDFRELSRNADGLSDRALLDAERVERHGAITRREEELSRLTSDIALSIEKERAALDAVRSEFSASFEAIGIAPGEPPEMLDWLREVRALLDSLRRNDDLADRIAELGSREMGLRGALSDLAGRLWIESPETLPTLALAKACERRIADVSEAWTESRGHADRVAVTAQRIEQILSRQTANREAARGWRGRADHAFADLGLRNGAGSAEARATIAIWRDLPALQSQRHNRQDRVDGMRRDAERFERDVAFLVGEIAPGLEELPAGRAVEEMRALAEAAYGADAALGERKTSLESAEREVVQSGAHLQTAETALAALVETLPDGLEHAALVDELTERDSLAEALSRTRTRLIDLAPAWSEDEVRDRIAGFDPERADLDIEQLELEEEALSTRLNEIYGDLALRRNEREALVGGEGAEAAVFEQKSIEAEMVEMARRWAVLKIASALVSATVDGQRQNQDAPLMRRAGEHFHHLTCGAYAGLSQEFADDDRTQLVALRGHGDTAERLRITDLSDGTRNQLYLALRLAFIEDYASRNEPIPFIGDDIFQTFDDERTASGLATLADASVHSQPILFTHHRRIVDIARENLSDAVDIIEI